MMKYRQLYGAFIKMFCKTQIENNLQPFYIRVQNAIEKLFKKMLQLVTVKACYLFSHSNLYERFSIFSHVFRVLFL